jgi:hypothetical protein
MCESAHERLLKRLLHFALRFPPALAHTMGGWVGTFIVQAQVVDPGRE